MGRRMKVPENPGELCSSLSWEGMFQRVPLATVEEVLEETGRASQRNRRLPATLVVYLVIGLAFYMEYSCVTALRCLWSCVGLLKGQEGLKEVTRPAITQARRRLGVAPLRALYARLVHPIAVRRRGGKQTRGAYYHKLLKVAIDGSEWAVPDTPGNRDHFGLAENQHQPSAYPLVRVVGLVEVGTRVFFGTAMGPHRVGEATLARELLAQLQPGMLCLADRLFFSYALWRDAVARGAELLWRVRSNIELPIYEVFPDGSYRSAVYASAAEREQRRNGLPVRVIVYRVGATVSRLITTLLSARDYPAAELVAEYPERWPIETAYGEIKTSRRGGADQVLRSQSPELVIQEIYGFLIAHFVVRSLIHEAALDHELDPDELSFKHALNEVRILLPLAGSFPPSAHGAVAPVPAGEHLCRQGRPQPESARAAGDQAEGEEVGQTTERDGGGSGGGRRRAARATPGARRGTGTDEARSSEGQEGGEDRDRLTAGRSLS